VDKLNAATPSYGEIGTIVVALWVVQGFLHTPKVNDSPDEFRARLPATTFD